ncbi:hypothetical protein K469DRAFT_550845, partial [Zopfia rhizophila CBS 207.26]
IDSDYNALTDALGLLRNDTKNAAGTQVEALGVEIDTITMTARLPQKKLDKAVQLVTETLNARRLTLLQAQKLAGFLSFCSAVVTLGRTYLRRLWTFTSTFTKPRSFRPLTDGVIEDLVWWRDLLPRFNGAFSHTYEPYERELHINTNEIRAIELAFKHWAIYWAHATVIVHTDNTTAEIGILKGHTKSAGMDNLRQILITAASLDIQLHAQRSFCRLSQRETWPATRETLGLWIVQRAFGSNAPHMGQVQGTTLQSYLSALRSVHVDLGLSINVFEEDHIQRLIQGAKNLFPAQSRRKRLPITRDILLDVLSKRATRGEDPIDTRNLNAAFTVAFSGFLRMGEFTYKASDLIDTRRFATERLTKRCITLSATRDHMILHLPRSKTDHDNTGVDIVVATAADDACPIHHMDTLLQQEPKEDGQPLFRLSNGAFTRAAQHAYNQHLSQDQIQALGRWGSNAFKRYYKTNPQRLFSLQRQFLTGHTAPPTN